ncbi:MAG: PAS domain-containing protein [Janthinobacterium lividum]
MTYSVRPAPVGIFLPDAVLDALGAGLLQLVPVYADNDPGTLVALTYGGVNAVAQQLLGLPDPPTGAFGTTGPEETALFAFCRDTFWSGEAGYYAPGYVAADGARWRVVAQRHAAQLVVSFTLERGPAPPALNQEALPTPLHQVFAHTPAAFCILHGPEYRFEYVNPLFAQLFANRPLEGLPAAVGLPAAIGEGVIGLLDRVYTTGEVLYDTEVPLTIAPSDEQPPQERYFHVTYQAHLHEGHAERLSVFATDVTEQVLSRAQVQHLSQEVGRARAEAEAQRLRLHDFMSAAPGIVMSLVGPQHVIEFANEGFRQISIPDPVGKSYLEAMPGAVGQYAPDYEATALYDHVYRTGEPYYAAEAPYYVDPTHTGQRELRYFTFAVQAARDGTGCITGVQAYATDVTTQVAARHRVEQLNQELEARVQERTRQLEETQADALAAAERRAQEREELYQVLAQTPAAIAITRGADHRYVYVNAASEALFAGRALVGHCVADALPEAEAQGLLKLLDQVYATGETFFGTEWPLAFAGPAGDPAPVRYFNFTYQVYREQEQVVGISTFAYDVTEQVLARQEHQSGLDQLHTVFEQAPVAIALFQGPDYMIEVANPAICQLWGRPQAAVLGQPLLAALPEIIDQGIPELLAEVRRTGEPFIAEELPVHLQLNGQLKLCYFKLVYQPLTDAQGHVTAIVVVATDVSARVDQRQQLAQANEELLKTNAQLTHTNTDLDSFIYTASHDLKAPIANIEGLLLLLRKQLPAEVQQVGLVPRVLGLMQESVERFRLTITQLSDLTRLQQVRTEPGAAEDLAAVIKSVRLDLAPLLEATGAQLQVDIHAGATMQFASQHLRSLLYNLLSNALKYRHPDRVPLVQLRCRREAAQAVLEVQDNGLGLSQAQQDKLFTLFQRLHTHVEGSGVGLYLVKRIVENAGGTVQVRSELGVGSTFTVYLPA